MAEKTKQHYVPKVYLKYFSLDNKTINLFNLKTQCLHTNIPFKDQFKGRYYYSSNLIVENKLGYYENTFNNSFIKIKNETELDSDEKKNILIFALLQTHRTNKNIQPISDIVKLKAKIEFNLQNPDMSSGYINETFDQYWKEKYDESNELEYEVAIDTLDSFFDELDFREYNITILSNRSGIGLISSDNPVCIVDIEGNRLKELGALSSNNIMLFTLGFDKLVIIYKKNTYRIIKKSLNKTDVLELNELIALNADNQLIVPFSFTEKKIQHWLSKLSPKVINTNAKPILKHGQDILFKFTPQYIENKINLKFIIKL